MKAKARKSCSNCRRLQTRVAALEATVARLREQLAAARKDSATSSKPPSSDIVKPPKPPPPEGQDRRKIGGQPGHPKHEREPFPPEAVNAGFFDYHIDLCPRCGHGLQHPLLSEPRVIQQVDINEVPLSIQEHRSHPGWCPCCQKLYEAPLPIGIKRGGLVGPKLTIEIAYLINPATKLIKDHKDLVIWGRTSIVPGRGAILCPEWSGRVGSKESSDGHRVTRWTS